MSAQFLKTFFGAVWTLCKAKKERRVRGLVTKVEANLNYNYFKILIEKSFKN